MEGLNIEEAKDFFAKQEGAVNAVVNETMTNAVERASEISLVHVSELIKSLHSNEETVQEDARTELETIKMTLQNVVDLSPENNPLAVSFSKTISEIENALATTN